MDLDLLEDMEIVDEFQKNCSLKEAGETGNSKLKRHNKLLRNDRSDPDNVVLLVGQEEFIVNRSQLESISPEFKILFEAGPVISVGINAFRICDIEPQVFELFLLQLIEKNNWEFNNLADAYGLLAAAVRFKINDLTSKIFSFFLQRAKGSKGEASNLFDESTACQAFTLFGKLESTDGDLTLKAKNYVLKHGAEIFNQNKFLHFSVEELQEILSSDDLQVRSELQVFKAVLRWGIHGLKNSGYPYSSQVMRDILGPLIPFVRFPNMFQQEFENYVRPLNILSSEQSNWLKEHAETEFVLIGDKMLFSNFPRKYCKSDDGEKEQLTRIMNPQKLETVQAELFIANFKLEVTRHNFAVEFQNQRQKMQSLCAGVQLITEGFQNLNVADNVWKNLLRVPAYKCLVEHEARKFKNAKGLAVAVVLENATTFKLYDPQRYFADEVSVYSPMPRVVAPQSVESFGFTGEDEWNAGLFSYKIGETLFVGKFCLAEDYNDVVIGFCPPDLWSGDELLTQLNSHGWFDHDDRNKACITSNRPKSRNTRQKKSSNDEKELEAKVKLGLFEATATFQPGNQALLSIVIRRC